MWTSFSLKGRGMSSSSLPWEESQAPHHGQGKTTLPLSQLLSQNIQLPVKPRKKSSPARVREKPSREERPEAEPNGARGFRTQSFPPASRGCAPRRQERKAGAPRVHGDPAALRAPAQAPPALPAPRRTGRGRRDQRQGELVRL